jgi:hypothetical protein
MSIEQRFVHHNSWIQITTRIAFWTITAKNIPRFIFPPSHSSHSFSSSVHHNSLKCPLLSYAPTYKQQKERKNKLKLLIFRHTAHITLLAFSRSLSHFFVLWLLLNVIDLRVKNCIVERERLDLYVQIIVGCIEKLILVYWDKHHISLSHTLYPLNSILYKTYWEIELHHCVLI